MVVKVITTQIGKYHAIETTFTKTILDQGVTRNFKQNLLTTVFTHPREQRLQQKRIRSGTRGRLPTAAAIVTDRPHHADLDPGLLEDLSQKIGRGGFTVSTGNPDQFQSPGRETIHDLGGPGGSGVGINYLYQHNRIRQFKFSFADNRRRSGG